MKRSMILGLALVVGAALTLGVVLARFTAASSGPPSGSSSDPGPGKVADPPSPTVPPLIIDPPPPLVTYEGPVEHIFFHPLIAYPERAFRPGSGLAQGYYDWFVTVPEFTGILDELYRNGYMLVDIRSLYEQGLSGLVRRELKLPAGKKPIVISVDDINYYSYMRENGNVFRLILDDKGRIGTYSETAGAPVISYNNEIIPILDTFVQDHPDFSLNGAKGVLALTGYEGILGYATHKPQGADYANQKQQALAVVKRLKETGWSFASHGWGHLAAAKISLNWLVQDTQRWKAEVEALTGPTEIYIFPFGSAVRPGDPKFKALQELGFSVFCSVGGEPFLQIKPGYVQMDRRHVDGMALSQQRKMLLPLFDVDKVIDRVNRPKR